MAASFAFAPTPPRPIPAQRSTRPATQAGLEPAASRERDDPGAGSTSSLHPDLSARNLSAISLSASPSASPSPSPGPGRWAPAPASFTSDSASPLHRGRLLKRRSTGADTTGSASGLGLDYYWSNSAGVGPSSSQSSLNLSSSPSNSADRMAAATIMLPGAGSPASRLRGLGLVSPGAGKDGRAKSKSQTNLREYLDVDMDALGGGAGGARAGTGLGIKSGPGLGAAATGTDAARPGMSHQTSLDSAYSVPSDPSPGSSSGHLRLDALSFRSSSDFDLHLNPNLNATPLESPASEQSRYSASDADASEGSRPPSRPAGGRANSYQVTSKESRTPDEYRRRFDSADGDARRGLLERSTNTAHGTETWNEREGRYDQLRESIASGTTVRPLPQSLDEPDPHRTPLAQLGDRPDLIPPMLTFGSGSDRQTDPSHHTPTGLARSAAPAQSSASGSGVRSSPHEAGETPRSAPAWRTEFGEAETVKGRSQISPAVAIETRQDGEMMGVAGLGPALPVRSDLRKPALDVPTLTTPLQISPRVRPIDFPQHAISDPPDTLDRYSSGTIADLTDMLGGAIDEIGLIDSRDTPPPTVLAPQKREKLKPNVPVPLVLSSVKADGSPSQPGPITPSSLPQRGESLPTADATPETRSQRGDSLPGPDSLDAPTPPSTQRPVLSHAHSVMSLSSTTTLTTSSYVHRPWPAAMLYGHIKNMKTPGERAKGYARGINDLAKAESGLKEWLVASASQPHHPPSRAGTTKKPPLTALSRRSDGMLSPPSAPAAPHSRNVSAGSEFPMRDDAYTAREISVRHIDPADQPTGLPANLPYPQLQQQIRSGIKPSASMQNVASVSSTKKGFFSAMRKGGKKDSAGYGLGPPMSTSVLASKKDVRGMSISHPRSTSPARVVEASAASAARAPSFAAPLGPRGPRGSFTPPPGATYDKDRRGSLDIPIRASLDAGLTRFPPTHAQAAQPPSRGSIDSVRTARSGMTGPLRGSPMAITPKEEEVARMSDVLPQADKAVLRAYLGKYGEQMNAIGAYLEDERKGAVMRA